MNCLLTVKTTFHYNFYLRQYYPSIWNIYTFWNIEAVHSKLRHMEPIKNRRFLMARHGRTNRGKVASLEIWTPLTYVYQIAFDHFAIKPKMKTGQALMMLGQTYDTSQLSIKCWTMVIFIKCWTMEFRHLGTWVSALLGT